MKVVLAVCFGTIVFLARLQVACGKESRFELGQRLRAFEDAWEKSPDPQARGRALPHLKTAVRSFFGFRMGEAGRALDRGRFALRTAAEPAPVLLWAAALWLRPETRFADIGAGRLGLSLASSYPVEVGVLRGTTLVISLHDANEKSVLSICHPIEAIPWKGSLSLMGLREGDYRLGGEVVVGSDRVALVPQTLSLANGLQDRLSRLDARLRSLGDKTQDTQTATLAAHLALLQSLRAGDCPETNHSAAHLLATAEEALKDLSVGEAYFGRSRTGTYWLTLASQKSRVPVRLLAPETVVQGKPLPLVIAWHGAGGSENMFFDAYGNGPRTIRPRSSTEMPGIMPGTRSGVT